MSVAFEDRRKKFWDRYDRLKLLYQWVKCDEISFKEFEELVNDIPNIKERDWMMDE